MSETISSSGGRQTPEDAWEAIDGLRNTARLLLRDVSVHSGPRSERYAACETIWHRAEGAAVTALVHADFETAISSLEGAVRMLASARSAGPRSPRWRC